MILLSNGGANCRRGRSQARNMIVGTVDGVACLEHDGETWRLLTQGLPGVFVSAVDANENGTLFAGTHGSGVARSRDGGKSWEWPNVGIDHFDIWSIRTGRLNGRSVVLAGTLPAHAYVSFDEGNSWHELPGLQKVPSKSEWCFPPPPRIGHVKDISVFDDKIFVGIEIGGLFVSSDGGETFKDLPLHPEVRERDVHRALLHPSAPGRILVSNGLLGMMRSDDDGVTWDRGAMPPESNYPDAIAMHPDDPNLLFLSVGVGWPPHWYKIGRARGKIARSRDGGRTWERLLGGLPDGQRGLFSAISIDAWDDGYAIYAADTDGQVFQSLDGGERWTVVADVGAVSKGEFYRGLAKGRQAIATIDDMVFSKDATDRLANASI